MSLSESQLQSQIALNQNNLYRLHLLVEGCYEEMQVQLEHHKYYAGLNVDKEVIKRIKAAHFIIINSFKQQIAKYVKLQKALKAELKLVRERNKRGAIVEAFITQQVNKLLLEK